MIDLVEVYDRTKNIGSYATRSPTARGDATGAVYNGTIYVAGGEFRDMKRKMTFWAVEAYNPAYDRWTELPHLQIARHGFAAAFERSRCNAQDHPAQTFQSLRACEWLPRRNSDAARAFWRD